MPPEWAERELTVMAWPVREDAWLGGLEEARRGYVEVANAIAEFEPVAMVARPGVDGQGYSASADARGRLSPAVEVWELPQDDSWTRDSGPTVLTDASGERLGVDWRFNAWGRKYSPWDADDALASRILERLGIPALKAPLVLEGGSIHVDGEGTLLSTEECLLNPNRNPELSRGEIEDLLRSWLGISTVLWLDRGLWGDETDGHVDNVACFAAAGTVVMQTCGDPSDPDYGRSRENLRRLRGARDAAGRALSIVGIPKPPSRSFGGEPLTLSYINYYPVTGGLVVPTFGSGGDVELESADRRALGILGELYPGRKIVAVDGMKIIKGGGNVHCITQQIPAGARRNA